MPHLSGIGTWFAPGSARAANNASDDIDSTLNPGSNFYDAANTGAAGQGIIDGAANLQNVGANFGAMDNDTAMLGQLSTDYLGQYLNGGQLTAAQQAQSQADLEHMNSSQLREGSQKEAYAVNNVKQSEDASNAENATQNRAAAAAIALKKATMQMLISHTNNMTALERQKLQQGVGNVGQSAALSLQGGANSARTDQMSIYESGRLSGAQTAIGIGTGLASAGAAAGGTLSSMLNAPAAGGVSGAGGATGSAVNSGYGAAMGTSGSTAAGYALPSAATGSAMHTGISRLATSDAALSLASGDSTYSPFSNEQVNSAYPLASAWGLSSLSKNTLPS